MKRTCKVCGLEKNIKRGSQCRECLNKKRRDYHAKKGKPIQHAYKTKLRNKARNFLLCYLLKNPCIGCGEGDPIVLDLHHHMGDKAFGISEQISQGTSLERIKSEIKKCLVFCSNCHRKHHAKCGNNWRYEYLNEHYLIIDKSANDPTAHYCPDWDFLLINSKCPEFDACTCESYKKFKNTH